MAPYLHATAHPSTAGTNKIVMGMLKPMPSVEGAEPITKGVVWSLSWSISTELKVTVSLVAIWIQLQYWNPPVSNLGFMVVWPGVALMLLQIRIQRSNEDNSSRRGATGWLWQTMVMEEVGVGWFVIPRHLRASRPHSKEGVREEKVQNLAGTKK